MPARADVVDAVVHALDAGGRVLLVGERGSGRTTVVREVGQRLAGAARGTGLRLVQADSFAWEMARSHESGVLVVEELQWADAATRAAVEAAPGPLLTTALPGTDLHGAVVVELTPLSDAIARELNADLSERALRRAGGNLRLLTSLVNDQVPSGVAARTLRGLWEGLSDDEQHGALLAGLSPAYPERPRIGALTELAVAVADVEVTRSAHEALVELLTSPGDRAPHLLALGRHDEARADARAGAEVSDDPRRVVELLRLAEPLDVDLEDRLAQALWDCWDLAGLRSRFADGTSDLQQALLLKASLTDGTPWRGEAPAGALARRALADGTQPGPPADPDGALAQAAYDVAAGSQPDLTIEIHDDEQRWQLTAIGLVDAWLHHRPLPEVALEGRWQDLNGLLVTAITSERDGASRDAAERLATLLAEVPTAWGHAALALCLADLGDAQEAAAALAAAQPRSATDLQVLALARADVALQTGRPRVALRALDAVTWWPVLAPLADAIADAARREVGEPATGGPVEWDGLSSRHAHLSQWVAADVPALRALEAEALERGWLPLLARVRESLRRQGERVARVTGPGEAAGALSPRETEVLVLVRDGLTSAQIATRLGVAQSTVETQVASAMRKLGARTRRHAVALMGAT